MEGRAGRTRAIGQATRRELLRRPGILLAAAGTAALLALLHELSAASFGARPGLAVELSVSSAGLFVSLVAGVMGVRCCAGGSDLGPSDALVAAPLSRSEYALGRFAGITTAAVLLLGLLAVGAAIGLALSGAGGLPDPVSLAAALVGVVAQACLFAALGMAVGAWLPTQFAVVLTVACLVASRTFVPALAVADGPLGTLALVLPDPARLDLARELGAGRPVDLAAAALAWCAALAFAAAMLTVAATALGTPRKKP